MSAPPPPTHISTGRTNSELNRVAPGTPSATSGATNTSVTAGKARFQPEATAASAVDMSTPQQRTQPGSYSCRISGYSRIREHPQKRQPGRLLHHCEVTSAVPALGRSTDPPGSSEETPRRPRDRLSTGASAVSLLQPLQPTLATDYVLVVPLDVSGFCQPALETLQVYLIGGSVTGFGGFEAAFLRQPLFLKRLTTPKEKTDALLQLAVPDNGVAIQKPHRVG